MYLFIPGIKETTALPLDLKTVAIWLLHPYPRTNHFPLSKALNDPIQSEFDIAGFT